MKHQCTSLLWVCEISIRAQFMFLLLVRHLIVVMSTERGHYPFALATVSTEFRFHDKIPNFIRTPACECAKHPPPHLHSRCSGEICTLLFPSAVFPLFLFLQVHHLQILLLRASGILLPFYFLLRVITAIQKGQRQQQRRLQLLQVIS